MLGLAVSLNRSTACRLSLLFLAFLAPLPLRSQDIEAGIDLWITHGKAAVDLHAPIPAGFFNPGSEPLPDLRIDLMGEALPIQEGTPSLGRADTAVERLGTARLPFCGTEDTVELRIVALRLQGGPVRVTYDGGAPAEFWDVRACLSAAPQQTGLLTIHRQCDDGGTFRSLLPLRPKLVFKRRGDGRVRVLDWIVYPDVIRQIPFEGRGGWVYDAPAGFPRITAEAGAVTDGDCDEIFDAPLPATTENFVIGLPPASCLCSGVQVPFEVGPTSHVRMDNPASGHFHPVDPASTATASFPQTRDRRRGRPEGESESHGFVASLGFGVILAALFSWRRRRSGPKD
jgi:hypothetical protein